MLRKLTIALAVGLIVASVAGADTLWDRSTFDPFGPGFFNVDAGSPPFGLTWHTVNHVVVPAGGWTMSTITTFYSALDPGWGGGITVGYLHVFPKTGALPTEDPTLSGPVTMSASLETDHWRVSASGLSEFLSEGEYWVCITPVAGAGPFGPEIHLASLDPKTGDDAASYDVFAFPGPPAWFVFNPGVEASMLIEGTFGGAVPVQPTTWGAVKSLYR